MKVFLNSISIFVIVSSVISCKAKKDEAPLPAPLIKKERSAVDSGKAMKGPIINIIDTIELKRIVLIVKDTAATSAGMSAKLNDIFNRKLPAAAQSANVKITGQPMAWYKSQKAYYSFEAGLPVDKAPAKAIKGISIKRTAGDSALVAHFFGPYELTTAGYEALNEMIKERGKKKASAAYEIYVKNPFEVTKEKTDPYKWQTDIVMPYK